MEKASTSQQVTFRRTVSPWPELRSLLPTLLFLSLLVAALAWMLVEAFEAENATLYACIAGPACFVAVFAFKYWQLSSVNKSTTLTLDAEGLRRTDGETVTYAKWADVTRLANQNTTLAMKPGPAAVRTLLRAPRWTPRRSSASPSWLAGSRIACLRRTRPHPARRVSPRPFFQQAQAGGHAHLRTQPVREQLGRGHDRRVPPPLPPGNRAAPRAWRLNSSLPYSPTADQRRLRRSTRTG